VKTLFIGGVKSGKSKLAEAYVLEQAKAAKPYYLATAECIDDELRARICVHRERRGDKFILIEEAVELKQALQDCPGPVLIDCISMWLNNLLYRQWPDSYILDKLDEIMRLPVTMTLVQNEVGFGIIPENALARQFVDLSGKASQLIGEKCNHVYYCCAGLTLTMK
jgi:adenosylcobinamide kinase / adenosylcobinamide-phosphate guanylyltransferase